MTLIGWCTQVECPAASMPGGSADSHGTVLSTQWIEVPVSPARAAHGHAALGEGRS